MTTSVNVSQLAPNIFILRALPITPITSSPDAAVDPAVTVVGMCAAVGVGWVIPEVRTAPTAVPHPPQNFVVALTGAPQFLQVRLSDDETAGKGVGADTTGVPHIPQNFSVLLIVLPQDLHTGRETGGGTSAFREGGGDGVAGKSSTFARHFPQNLSPGLITYPHDRHNRVPNGGGEYDAGGGGGASVIGGGGGGETGVEGASAGD